jgi:N,N-dimethylformamidase
MLRALDAYLRGGGRLMYMGGNGFYWVTSIDPTRPHMIEVRRGASGSRAWTSAPGEHYHAMTGELGGLWRHRGHVPQATVGIGFTAQCGLDRAHPYRRTEESRDPRVAFIFAGVEDEIIGDFGLHMGGAAGWELDRADMSLGTPPHALVLASSFGHSNAYQHVVEEIRDMDPNQGGAVNPLVRADLTYFEGLAGGAVFSVGSISWCGCLSHNNYDNNIARITGNVLDSFSAASWPRATSGS